MSPNSPAPILRTEYLERTKARPQNYPQPRKVVQTSLIGSADMLLLGRLETLKRGDLKESCRSFSLMTSWARLSGYPRNVDLSELGNR
jgi:hypothetical protein